ncbi:MAG: hypothetical protein Q9222_006421, partial [Ikaeria aurantiellina]
DADAATLAAARELCISAIPSLTESRGGELVATVTIMLVVATIAVILRLYARKISASRLGADDYLILVALTDEATQVLFGCSITATKLSILFFYHRLFPFRTFFIVSLIVGIASILWWVGLMLTAFLHCQPLAYYWDRSIPGGHCVNDNLIGYAITSVNIVTDLVVLILPIPWLWGMNMAVPKRMAVVGLFILGSFVCIAGIVRIPLLSELHLSDITWTSISVGVWVNVECNIGIVSACLPILRPLFSTKYTSSPVSYFTRILRSISSSKFSSSHGGSSNPDDPEKGAVSSEPGSDATAADAGLRWPRDTGAAGGWRWSRNNSYSVAVTDAKPPGGSGLGELPPAAASTTDRRQQPTDFHEKEKKRKTWYTAAAEMLPEMDLSKLQALDRRKVIDPDDVPRYRDDAVGLGRRQHSNFTAEDLGGLLSSSSPSDDRKWSIPTLEGRGWERGPEILVTEPATEIDSQEANTAPPSFQHGSQSFRNHSPQKHQRPRTPGKARNSTLSPQPSPPAPPAPQITEQVLVGDNPPQRSLWRGRIPEKPLPNLPSASSDPPSKRSSWGRARDTWNLMPSVAFWERRDSVLRAMNLNLRV